MKGTRIALSLLLALALALSLCACGGAKTDKLRSKVESVSDRDTSANEAYAGEYTFCCARFGAAYMDSIFDYDGEAQAIPDRYVDTPEMAGETVLLKADGTGYLYWGEDNQGLIDWWTVEGDSLAFQAGVSVFDGTIRDGFMTVEIEDGFALCFALPDADTSDVEPIPVDDYFLLLYGLAPDGAEPEAETEDASSLEGEYTVFAVQTEGYLVEPDVLEIASTLTLTADGSGFMTIGDEAMDIRSWTAESGMLTVVLADDSSAQAAVRSGVLELDIWGDGGMILCYAREGTDISAYDPMTLEELMEALEADAPDSRLRALWESLDTETGVHMRYDLHTEFMDADQSIDVHGKDGVYYSRRTTTVSGFENTVITFFRDGTAYNLFPKDMTGVIATTTTSSIVSDNVMRLDALYSAIWNRAQESDYSVETREMDGVTYTVEVFPASEYQAESAFYFDSRGQLAYYIEGAPVIDTVVEIGELVYTIHTIDDAVDETLFDISGYDITE